MRGRGDVALQGSERRQGSEPGTGVAAARCAAAQRERAGTLSPAPGAGGTTISGATGGKRGHSDHAVCPSYPQGVADLEYALKKAGESKSVRFAKLLDGRSDGGRSAGGRSVSGRSVGGRSAGGVSTGSKAGSQAGGKGAHSGKRFKSRRGGGDVKGGWGWGHGKGWG